MNQFWTILKFELKGFFRNKVFVGVTVFLMALITIVMFLPRIVGFFESDTGEILEDLPVMLIAGDQATLVQDAFAAAFPDYSVKIYDESLEDMQSQITGQEAECAFYLDSLTSYTYYVNNLSLYDSNTEAADQVLSKLYQLGAMAEGGISQEKAMEILSAPIDHETMSLGKDQAENFFYTYIMIFALYMVILMYGQMVATNVATEKSSRAMELLITSARPTAMMFGKVIASCLAGLAQLVLVFGSALLVYRLNESQWSDVPIMASIFNMPLSLLLYMLLFFMLGFFIYAFLYGAVGSTATKLEDINTSVMPITILFIIAFLVVIFSMTSGNVDNLMLVICSYIPFTSPMAMFTRIAMSTVPVYEILISVAILIGSVIGVGILSAKIYRVGVLLYGTSPKPSAIFKAVRNA